LEDWKIEDLEDWKTEEPKTQIVYLSPIFQSSGLPTFQPFLIAGAIFIASFSLYLSTLAPSVVTLFDDSLEFQLITYQLGIAHPTGYPLYTLLGKLFTFLPIGNVAYRVNLLSAFFGAATLALLYLLILQMTAPKNGRLEEWKVGKMEGLQPSNLPILKPSWPAHLGGVIGAALFAVSPIFWQQATVAEIYTLNAFFVVTLLLVASLLSLKGRGWGWVLWLAFLFGLALTHHRTILLLIPSLGLYLYLNQNPGFLKKPGFYKTLLFYILLGLAPLLLYLYLPFRGHIGSLDGAYENTWSGFWRQVSASGYGTFIFDNPFGQERDLTFYWNLFQSQFYTMIPGLIGLFYLLWRGQRRLLVLTGTAFLIYVIFNLFYQVSDIEVFFIPPFLIWVVWSGVGIAFVLQLVVGPTTTGDRRPGTGNRQSPVLGGASLVGALPRLVLTGLVLAIFAFIIFQLFQTNLPTLQARNTWQVHDYGLDILQQPLPKHSAIVGILGEMTLLRYFQQTENRRPDVETVAADLEADRLAAVEKLLAEGKSVYLTRELSGAQKRWSLSAVGPLIRVNPEPVTAPPDVSFTVNQPVIPEITLLGYDLSRPPRTGDGPVTLRLTLFWQATAPLTTNLKVSARLLDPKGEVIVATDAVPVHFAYPTTAWRRGEIVSDVYDLVLTTAAPPGSYTPVLIWYDPAQNAAEVGRIELNSVTIE
jgi:hypothetical protein